ncbi:MAG: hypothetical protein GX555_09240 [Actinomycetales bacterium]|nr:hypothetical protein [Actinomycetales bacterium]
MLVVLLLSLTGVAAAFTGLAADGLGAAPAAAASQACPGATADAVLHTGIPEPEPAPCPTAPPTSEPTPTPTEVEPTATETTSPPGPTETEPGPTETEPGPTETEPGPTETEPGPTQTSPAPEAIEVAVSLSAPTSPVGSDLTVTATVQEDGAAVDGASVRLLGHLDGEPDVDLTLTTNAAGVVSFTYTREVAGTEALTVTATWGEEEATATDSVVWVAPDGDPEIAIAPLDGTGTVGELVDFVATVTHGGLPVAGADVTFIATMDGVDPVTLDGVTEPDGTVTFEHSRSITGVENILVILEPTEEEIFAETSFTWAEPAPVAEIYPRDSHRLIGDTVIFDVTVTLDGQPLEGQMVSFYATMPGAESVSQTGFTGPGGVASFEHSREVAGVDRISVDAYPAGAYAETTLSWWPPGPAVQIEGPAAGGLVGEPAEFVATVVNDGFPAWDEPVQFTASMAGVEDVVLTGRTDKAGRVAFVHTRDATGIETVTVEALGGTTAETTYTWYPEGEAIRVDPRDSSGQPGTVVEFAATVTDDGVPVEGVTVDFLAVLQGTEDFVSLDAVTDDDGVARFSHVREGYGVDDISVSTEGADDGTIFTWRRPLEVTLSAGTGTAEVGTPVTVTVTVGEFDPGSGGPAGMGPDWVETVDVRFLAQLPGEPDVDVTLTPDAEGVATYTHTRTTPGTESLLVEATALDETVSATGTLVWEEPPPEVLIEVEPLDSSAQPGTTVEFAATVTGDGVPLPGEVVYFFAILENTEDSVFIEGVTGSDGVARFDHVREVYGVDDIFVSTAAFGQEAAAETIFTWRRPLEVTLSAGTGSAEVGTPVTVTVTVGEFDPGSGGPAGMGPDWVETVDVRFLAQLPGEPDVDVTLTPDAEGVATYTHTRLTPGTESLLVEATALGETVTATGSLVWEAPLVLTVEPVDSSGPIGVPVEFAATLTSDGSPVVGETVSFAATLEGTEDTVFLTAETDADGVARFTHVRSVLGVDLIEVWVEGEDVSAETTFTWVEEPPVLTLSQSATTGEVGTPLELTATLTDGGQVVPGAGVRFLAQLPGEPDVDVTVPTDADGVATFTHTRTVSGTESLLAGATVGDDTVFASGSFEWVVPPPVVQLAVEPLDSSGPVGNTVDFVATVTADGQPLAEQSVTFTAGMPGAPLISLVQQTGADGTAHFAHTRSAPGVDGIVIGTTALDQTLSTETTFTWEQPPPPPAVLTLSQSGTTGEVGTPLEWTATVTVAGQPVEGANVRFLGQLTGATDVDVTLTTNSAGVATHTHTRSVSGTESLQVTTTVGAQDLIATGSFAWVPGAPPTTPPTSPPTTPPTAPPTTPPTSPPTQTTPVAPIVPPLTPTTPPTAPPDVTETEEPTTSEPTTEPEPAPEPEPQPEPEPEPGPTDGSATRVELGRESAIPGGDLDVSGSGCPPGSTVVVSLAGETLGTSTADANGAFSVRAAVANVPLGQYAVDVQCGEATGQATVDLVSTVESSTAVASAASAAAVLTFFVLLGTGVVKQATGGV